MNKTDKQRREQAKKHLARIRELVAQRPSPFAGMTEEQAIEKMREIREELWEKKIAVSTGHK